MRRISEKELANIEHELCQRLGSDIDAAATTDFATRSLGRLLSEYRELRRENEQLRGAKNLQAA